MSDAQPLATPPEPPGAAPAGGGSRALRIGLAVSVALNLAVLGLGLGFFMHPGPVGHGDMVRDIGFGPFNEALRPEDRRDLLDKFLSRTPNFPAERQRMRADADAVLTALRADPFVPAALNAALHAMEQHIVQRMDLGGEVLGDFLTNLPPADRLAFADRLQATLQRGPARD